MSGLTQLTRRVRSRPEATVLPPPERPGSGTGPAIVATGLTKRYGPTIAVDELTLEVERGQVFGLLGPNGAGKTTTILMLLGLTEPSAGTALVDGLDPTRQPLEVKARVGYLPDEVGFYDDLTAIENLSYTAALNRLPPPVARSRIGELLEAVGLADSGRDPVRTFSRGMRQRLGLADALVKDPRILILDEPTVNIDPEGVRELLLLVEQLRTEQGVTVLLSSHLLHQVQQVCDRIGLFVSGRLVASGTLDELADSVDDRWSISVGVDGLDQPAELLAGLDGVRSIERSHGRWVLTAGGDVRAAVFRLVRDHGGTLTHLSRDGADLDAVYHHYFQADRDDSDGDGDGEDLLPAGDPDGEPGPFEQADRDRRERNEIEHDDD